MTKSFEEKRTRKWLVTMNNPEEKGFTREYIKKILESMKQLEYWCIADEIGENGTAHFHLYLVSKNAVRFETMKKKFTGAHFDFVRGTSQETRDYIFKQGKHAKTDKEHTNIKETHEEWGDCPLERKGARTDIDDLYTMIKDGMTTKQIIDDSPQYMLQIDKIERVRQMLLEEKNKNKFRELEVTYIWGESGTGKTRHVMEKYGYENVHKVTNYDKPFDTYLGQEVLLLDEYRSSIKIQDILQILDGYPLALEARYNKKQACYTKVYIVSNWEPLRQYKNIQKDDFSSWRAWIRRIKMFKEFFEGGKVDEIGNPYIGMNNAELTKP